MDGPPPQLDVNFILLITNYKVLIISDERANKTHKLLLVFF